VNFGFFILRREKMPNKNSKPKWTAARRLKYRQYAAARHKKGVSPAPREKWLYLQYHKIKKKG